MNNTHTGGCLQDSKQIIGINQYRSGVSTPTGNQNYQFENSLKQTAAAINSLEESKISHISESKQNV